MGKTNKRNIGYKTLIYITCAIGMLTNTYGQVPKFSANKVKKVEKKPYAYEFPTNPVASLSQVLEKPWVVYSDRNENTVFADSKLSSATGKVKFLDSFYVASVSGDAFELIKYSAGIVKYPNLIASPDKIEYVGWIDRYHLILNDNSFIEAASKRPLKYVAMLNGNKVFDNLRKYSDGLKIRVYSDAELTTQVDTAGLYFDQIVYVFRQYKDRVLIGRSNSFSPKNASKAVIGWVHASFIQSWGSRLCVEPADNSPKIIAQTALYANKEQANNFRQNAALSYPMQRLGCDINEHLWNKTPVFNIEYFNDNSGKYKIFKSGVVLNPFDRTDSYIYNVNGTKLQHSKLCELINKSENVNIVFAINMDNDTKEYLYVLINTIQELGNFFASKSDEYNFKFGTVNCSAFYSEAPELKEKFSDIMPKLVNMAKGSVENKKTAATLGIVNGLTNANKHFKGLEKETNIVVMISSQADAGFGEVAYKAASEKITDELAKNNARMIFYQPYNGNGNNYSAFVQEAKSLIKRSTEKVTVYKREKQVGSNLESSNVNSFKGVSMGSNNVYCLDYPQNSTFQSFIVFPTVGNKTEGKYLNDAIDSLLVQVDYDNRYMIKSISNVFNSPTIFNNNINKLFERYYSSFEAPNKDAYSAFKNTNYNYFASGFTIVPKDPNNSVKYFKQSLLLSKDEYNEMYDMFKSLRFDVLAGQYDDASKQNCYRAVIKVIETYSAKKQTTISKDISLARFFHEVCGYTPDHVALHAYNINKLTSPIASSDGELKAILEHLNRKLQKFYSLKDNSRYIYLSGSVPYYWVSEDYLP